MWEEIPFLKAICNQPDDDLVRLVYADWLEERGDPRADFLRLEVERHRREDKSKKRPPPVSKEWNDWVSCLDPHWTGVILYTRGRPMGVRRDVVQVTDGKGLIDVRGGDGEIVLLVEGKPVAFNWDDCQGSVGQFLVFTGHSRGADHARQLAEFVDGNVHPERSLSAQIEPLLALLPNGIYGLGYSPTATVEPVTTLENSPQSIPDMQLHGYYPVHDRNLVCTQRTATLDASRIRHFRQQIRKGHRPIVLTVSAEGAWCEFVIDGHHKLTAYNREGVRPTILGISRWHAPVIDRDEGLAFFPPGHPGAREYRRMKR